MACRHCSCSATGLENCWRYALRGRREGYHSRGRWANCGFPLLCQSRGMVRRRRPATVTAPQPHPRPSYPRTPGRPPGTVRWGDAQARNKGPSAVPFDDDGSHVVAAIVVAADPLPSRRGNCAPVVTGNSYSIDTIFFRPKVPVPPREANRNFEGGGISVSVHFFCIFFLYIFRMLCGPGSWSTSSQSLPPVPPPPTRHSARLGLITKPSRRPRPLLPP